MTFIHRRSGSARTGIVVALFAIVATIAVLMLAVDISRKKAESRQTFFHVVELTEETADPAVWGQNYPLQYEGYLKTVDQVRTRFGGSDALPQTPTNADPRSVVTQSKLVEDPRLKRMWAGYGFSIDHREERGHAYMLDDQTFTGRQQKPQPGACIQCHASVAIPYRELGNGDLGAGAAKMNAMPFAEARTHVTHPIACIDCHEPATMRLRITHPAFMDGIAKLKAKQGVPDYDVNTMASRAEMRTYVCAQCHDEYYFAGADTQLTFPWDNGIRADEILARYDELGFRDWVHGETGAPMLKAQHPEFEFWSQGIHARAGASCVDCHMPYKRVGAMKITDHHVRSPLLNIGNACQVCHPVPEDELLARAEAIQERTLTMQDTAMERLMEFIDSIKSAQTAGADAAALDGALQAQRRATFLIDYVAAENSSGFHAPQEAARLLFLSLNEILAGTEALPKSAPAQ